MNPGLDSPVRLELLGEVPADPAVREAVQRRELLFDTLPGAPASMALAAIVGRMTAGRKPGPRPGPRPRCPPRRRRGARRPPPAFSRVW